MRTLLLCSLLVVSNQVLKAQLFGKQDISVQSGVINFHAKSLNNSVNSNYRLSRVTEVDKHIHLGRFASFCAGLGGGNLQNMDNRFTPHQSSQFFRVKLGLVLHLPQAYSSSNWSPKKLNPYFKVSYNIDRFDATYKEIEGRYTVSSVRMGLGAIIKVNHYVGVLLESSHNQCLSSDFRTYFQNNIGVIVNMDQILLKR